MGHWNRTGEKYSPFAVTQIFEEQNCFILQDDFVRKNYSQFNHTLYKYLDRKLADSSFFRIFRIEEKVALVYYWKSNKREPRSGRDGIYLITGVLCDYRVFRKKPIHLYKACRCLLELIMEKYDSKDCTQIIERIWKEKEQASNHFGGNTRPRSRECGSNIFSLECGQDISKNRDTTVSFEEIGDSFRITNHQCIQKNDFLSYKRKIRFGECRLYLCLPSSSFEDIPLFFVSEAANWICHRWGKTDIASIEGFGDGFINVRLNNQGVPSNMKRVKLEKRFDKTYLEIRTF